MSDIATTATAAGPAPAGPAPKAPLRGVAGLIIAAHVTQTGGPQ